MPQPPKPISDRDLTRPLGESIGLPEADRDLTRGVVEREWPLFGDGTRDSFTLSAGVTRDIGKMSLSGGLVGSMSVGKPPAVPAGRGPVRAFISGIVSQFVEAVVLTVNPHLMGAMRFASEEERPVVISPRNFLDRCRELFDGVYAYPDGDEIILRLLGEEETYGAIYDGDKILIMIPESKSEVRGIIGWARREIAYRRKILRIMQSIDPAEMRRLQETDPNRAPTALFGFKGRILQECKKGSAREMVYGRRFWIAAIFRQFGGERLEEGARFFEGLQSPDELSRYVPEKGPADVKRAEQLKTKRGHTSGYYTFGGDIIPDQIRALKDQNRSGLKVGDPKKITLLELFKIDIFREDKRPIYIPVPLTDEIRRQLSVLIIARLDLGERIFLLEWGESGVLEKRRFMETAIVKADNKTEKEVATLKGMIFHRPREGEIFNGVITRVVDFGVLVEFLPGIEGVVHKSEIRKCMYRNDVTPANHYRAGDVMPVKVIKVRRIFDEYIYDLSERLAQDSLEDGRKPLFADIFLRAMRLLQPAEKARLLSEGGSD